MALVEQTPPMPQALPGVLPKVMHSASRRSIMKSATIAEFDEQLIEQSEFILRTESTDAGTPVGRTFRRRRTGNGYSPSAIRENEVESFHIDEDIQALARTTSQIGAPEALARTTSQIGAPEAPPAPTTSQRGALLLRLDRAVGATTGCMKDGGNALCVPGFGRLQDGQTGGVYRVPSSTSGLPMAVFKPDAEENFERRGIPTRGGAVREEAAYLLDRLSGSVAGVPVTTRARVPRPVLHYQATSDLACGTADSSQGSGDASPGSRDMSPGSVQSFVPQVAGSAEDYAMPRQLQAASQMISTVAAQHIACLDIRLCNTDRHGGNLLFQKFSASSPSEPKSTYRPVPIDHGCALPRWWSVGEANFEAWLSWPQVRAPCVPEVLATITKAFQGQDKAVEALADIGLDLAAQATYRIVLNLLYECIVTHGLSLFAVASLIARSPDNFEEPSWLEYRMEECYVALGLEWRWTVNTYGDKVPALPEDLEALPPSGFLEKLSAIFESDATLVAGRRLERPMDGS